jgi:type II secretory pathway component PulC
LKDPFRLFKPVKETKKIDIVEIPVNPPELQVSGLVWGAETPQAIINGKVVKIGDTVENARIENIGKSGVVIEFSGKKFTLPVAMNIPSRRNREDQRAMIENRNNNTQDNYKGGPQGVFQGGKNDK